MKGKIFKYGKSGDPLVRSENGKIIVLGGYEQKHKPQIGSIVEYKVTSQGVKVDYGRILGGIAKKSMEEDLLGTLEEIISIIDRLDKDYEKYLKNEGIILD